MGTGTGVLAILAEKRGANEILAVDIEPWSVENTAENIFPFPESDTFNHSIKLSNCFLSDSSKILSI